MSLDTLAVCKEKGNYLTDFKFTVEYDPMAPDLFVGTKDKMQDINMNKIRTQELTHLIHHDSYFKGSRQ